jgi:hypothetical protein
MFLNILLQNEKNETFFITYSHISCISITPFKGAKCLGLIKN